MCSIQGWTRKTHLSCREQVSPVAAHGPCGGVGDGPRHCRPLGNEAGVHTTLRPSGVDTGTVPQPQAQQHYIVTHRRHGRAHVEVQTSYAAQNAQTILHSQQAYAHAQNTALVRGAKCVNEDRSLARTTMSSLQGTAAHRQQQRCSPGASIHWHTQSTPSLQRRCCRYPPGKECRAPQQSIPWRSRSQEGTA